MMVKAANMAVTVVVTVVTVENVVLLHVDHLVPGGLSCSSWVFVASEFMVKGKCAWFTDYCSCFRRENECWSYEDNKVETKKKQSR